MAGCMSRLSEEVIYSRMPGMSQEEIYFFKLDTIIKKVATAVVLKHFNAFIPPNDLVNVLNNNVGKIHDLYKKKIIRGDQLDVLVSVPGVQFPFRSSVPHRRGGASSEDFDITLMICILRNLNFVPEPSSGWDNLPPKNDITLAANLTRIKIYRNKLAHLSKNEICEKKFKDAWYTLQKALSEMSNGETDSVVHEIETFHFDTSDKDELLKRIQEQIKELKEEIQFHRNFKENTSSVLKKWRNDLRKFYMTRGTQEVIQSIETNDVVMIIGNSGSGKTTSMKYASLELQGDGYDLVLISSPRDIPSQRFVDRKQLFIMDDVVGKYRVDSMALDMWERLHDRISVAFNDKGAKLLLTLRRQLHNTVSQIPSSILSDSKVVDLDSEDLALSRNEKLEMLENYLENTDLSNDINFEEKSIICSCTIAFPLLCNIFSSNQDFLRQRANFFQSPSIIFREEFERLRRINKEVYCVLVLLLIFDFQELKSVFDINCEINRTEVYHLILRACEVHENIPRISLLNYLQTVSGSFVEATNHFKFMHDTLEESIASHFGSRFPDVMLQCCKLQFIRDRVRLTRLPTDDENVLVLAPSSYAVLSERILKEIMNGKFRDVLLCEPMQNENFIAYFTSYVVTNHMSLGTLENLACKENIMLRQQYVPINLNEVTVAKKISLIEVLQNTKNRFIHWITAMGSFPLFKAFFERPKTQVRKAFERYRVVTDLLHLAVHGENMDVIRLLIRNGGNVHSYDEYGIPLLCKVAGTNRCDIAEFLIDQGADVNQADQVLAWRPCSVAIWFNEVEMLKLLISRGALINEIDFEARVPLMLAVMKSNEESVSVLLKNNVEIFDHIFNTLKNPFNLNFLLQMAIANRDAPIVKLLTNFRKSRNEIWVIFPPMGENSRIILELFGLFLTEIKQETSVNPMWNDFITVADAVNSNDIQSLTNVFNKNDDIVTFSYLRGDFLDTNRKERLAKFNKNYLQFSALHIAAICDNVAAAKLLIQYGANPLQRDALGRCSLHLANSSKMLKVLLNSKMEMENSLNQSLIHRLLRYVQICFTFEFISAFLNHVARSSADVNVNIQDNQGNTPLHSMVIRISDMDRCLDAVKTLIKHGASTDIRCSKGFLPIDHFRALSLKFNENVVNRGEQLLGGEKIHRFMKKEKRCLIFLIGIFFIFYISIYVSISKFICIQMEPSEYSHQVSRVTIKWFASYAQLIMICVLHIILWFPVSEQCGYVFRKFETKPSGGKWYSQRLFIGFSMKVSLIYMVVRGLSNTLNSAFPTDAFFNCYCAFLCLYMFVFSSPHPWRNVVLKYQSFCFLTVKLVLVLFLNFWILCLFFMKPEPQQTDVYNAFETDFGWTDFFQIIALKLLLYRLFSSLFMDRLLRPLLYIKLQPLVWRRHEFNNIVLLLQRNFIVLDLLSIPLTMVFCSVCT